jgi:hypothetical protein
MRNFVIAGAAICIACVPPAANDPHAAGPARNQWVATVPGAPSQAFDVAMRVLTDSSYRIADARKDAGLIRTENRKASDVQRGMTQLKTLMGVDYPVRLSVLVLPAGSDSTRITLTGEYTLENIGKSAPITTTEKTWPLMSGIGNAIIQSIGGK